MVRIIAITGGSGSGKTTLATMLRDELTKRSVTTAVLSQDDYYHDQSTTHAAVNFDHPTAVDFDLLTQHLGKLVQGEQVQSPVYDFSTHSRTDQYREVVPATLVLVEGILLLTHARMRSLFDYSVYLACDRRTRLQRRLDRDVVERGRTTTSVRAQFAAQVEPMHQKFVEPSQRFAQMVLTQAHLQQELSRQTQRVTTVLQSLYAAR